MTANIQISGKANNGIIFVVGGENFDDFFGNLTATLGGDVHTADEIVQQAARLITPPSVGGVSEQQAAANLQQQGFAQQAPPQQQYQQQPVQQYNQNRQPAGPPPGQQAPLCPNHGQPAKWVPPGVAKGSGKPYPGFFACAVAQRGDRSCQIK